MSVQVIPEPVVMHNTTFRYQTDPDYREASIKYHVDYIKQKCMDDPEYHEKRKALSRQIMAERYKNDPAYRAYCSEKARERYLRKKQQKLQATQ